MYERRGNRSIHRRKIIMKKRFIIISIIFLFVAVIVGYGFYKQKERKEWETAARLQILYKWQNYAFRVLCNHEERLCYQGTDKIELQELVVYLHIYDSIQNKYQLTVDEVMDYLSDEYDSEGKLKVYSRPENIEDYIDNYPEVDELAEKFGDEFNEYLMKKGYPHVFRNMTYEEVVEALEKYKNDPEYIPPHEKDEEPSVEVSQEEIVELSNKIATKKYEMEKAGYSEEEIDEAIKQMIEDYKNGQSTSDDN